MSGKIPVNVQRGASLLDERLPGWRKRVHPGDLELENECSCVLGQVFGGYTEGSELLGLNSSDAKRYGFWRQDWQGWETLTKGWRKVLRS